MSTSKSTQNRTGDLLSQSVCSNKVNAADFSPKLMLSLRLTVRRRDV